MAYDPSSPAPFGHMLTAMVTPFTEAGEVDYDGVAALAAHLVDEAGNDGLIINGTTGESPTLRDDEKLQSLKVVLETVGDRATIVAGAGNNDTRHTIEIVREAEAAGAHGLLLVTPYYNKPPQSGIAAHFLTVADATGLPIMTYDIPGRTGVPIEPDTFARIAEHPRIVANKDAKADVASSAAVIARTGLAWYSGDDALTLPLLSVGGCGVVSVVGHVLGQRIAAMMAAHRAGEVARATELNASMIPAYVGIFRTQGVILTKAALRELGLPAGPVRLPLVDATEQQRAILRADLAAAGVPGFAA
ncbi:MAG TPA: 4-hydroxy-tetrahydrodipicolinate synthase [Candidatus Nanopelagicales bacterium]